MCLCAIALVCILRKLNRINNGNVYKRNKRKAVLKVMKFNKSHAMTSWLRSLALFVSSFFSAPCVCAMVHCRARRFTRKIGKFRQAHTHQRWNHATTLPNEQWTHAHTITYSLNSGFWLCRAKRKGEKERARKWTKNKSDDDDDNNNEKRGPLITYSVV